MQIIFRLSILLFVIVFATNELHAQKQTKKISFLIRDADKNPVADSKVELIENNGKVHITKTDKYGMAWFDVAATSDVYTKAKIKINTTASKKLEMPIIIPGKTTHLNIEIPSSESVQLDGTASSGAEEEEAGERIEALNYIKPNIPKITYGPYTPECDENPLASVPEFSSFAVEDEQSVLDEIGSSCLGVASDAVNSLVDVTEAMVTVSVKIKALFDQTSPDPLVVAVKIPAKIPMEETRKSVKAVEVAYENTKSLYEAMISIAEGPEIHALTCLWDGVKKYATPAEVTKMQKALGSFEKAKKAVEKKVKLLDALNAGKKGIKDVATVKMLEDWDGIMKNTTASQNGLSTMLAYLSSPRKFLSSESQANIALENVQAKIGTLLGDCRIREEDEEVNEGMEAAKSALASARKFQAQMGEKERKSRDNMTNASGTRPWYNASYDHQLIPANAQTPVFGAEGQWAQYVGYHNERVKADEDVKRIGVTMGKLSELCNRIQSFAPTLNGLVEKYKKLYSAGYTAVYSCDFKKADEIIAQLKYQEQTPCGHFYPAPLGITSSEELADRLARVKKLGTCNVQETAGKKPSSTKPSSSSFGLVSKEVGVCAPPADGQYGVLSGKISEGSIHFDYKGKPGYDAKADITATFSKPPSTLVPGDTIEVSVDVAADVTGKDVPYYGISAKWSVEGAAEVVTGKSAFGGFGSDGKLYPGGKETFKIKIGQGSKIVLWTTHAGIAWGNGGKWFACVYTYEWKKPAVQETPPN